MRLNDTIHNFSDSLERSKNQANAKFWNDLYETAFPDILTMASMRDDGWAQRAGIDRSITLKSGKTLWIDEKVRYVDYGDILLEYYSDYENKTLGWAVKDLASDYIAYAIVPKFIAYLFPFQDLKRAARKNMQKWVNQYGFQYANNVSYKTAFIPVPKIELFSELNKAMEVKITSA